MLNTPTSSTLEIQHAWVKTGHSRTHYLSAGDGAPLVLLHGAGGDSSLFSGIIPALALTRTVLAPDLLGHGKNECQPGLYTVPAYLGWLDSFIDALGLDPVDLVGHSLGGALGLRYAGKYPAKVNRLVLVDAISLGPPSLPATLKLLTAMFTRNQKRSRALIGQVMFAGDDASRQEKVATFLGGDASPPTGMRGFLWMLSRTWQIALPVPGRTIAKIHMPTLIMWGEADMYFAHSHAQRPLRLLHAGKLALIPQAGHAPFLEEPTRFLEILEEWLGKGKVMEGGRGA